jgi:GT2 family glycosyltransferase
MQIVRALSRAGHRLTYVARSAAGKETYEPLLRDLDIEVYSGDAQHLRAIGFDIPVAWNFKNLVRREKFDLAILFHWFWNAISITEQYLPEIRQASPQTRIVVLSDDRHGAREEQMAQLTGHFSDVERAEDYWQREAECYRAADVVAAISDEDARVARRLAAGVPVVVVPMAADLGPTGHRFSDRKDLLLLANYDNLANRDGLHWLCTEVWPLVRARLPDVRLHLAGNNLPEGYIRPDAGIESLGFVDDLAGTLAVHRVFVSPVRFGTGIKTKNLLALAHGIPLVTTSAGVEGLALTDGEHALVEDSPVSFAHAIECAYKNVGLWQRLAAGGRKHISQRFSTEALAKQLEELLQLSSAIAPSSVIPAMSVMQVESVAPDVLVHTPAIERFEKRASGYLALGKHYLETGQYEQALGQFRHSFCYVRGALPPQPIFKALLQAMERCYRELGDAKKAQRCRTEFDRLFVKRSPVSCRESSAPEVSVIIPTYNRAPTLSGCLDALANQSVRPDQFEVIVVDDGSSDATDATVRRYDSSLQLRYLRQQNQGAGAARRRAVEAATAPYLLLINDDTIAGRHLLRQHLDAHQSRAVSDKIAILGEFRYPEQASRRALTHYLQSSEFLFPQRSMKRGVAYGAPHFITCNISIAREPVLQAGSFDPALRVAEDTDLGYRLEKNGYSVFYEPAAVALHNHLQFSAGDLVKRADGYGQMYLHLLRKYPDWLGRLPLGFICESLEQAIMGLRERLERERAQVQSAVDAIRQYDEIDFMAFASRTLAGEPASDLILKLFAYAVPAIHWHFLFTGLLNAWNHETSRGCVPPAAESPQGVGANA